ncbi:MAG: TolC family protein [Halobacteriovoraceae bacterium]|jgi:outer membrane protein TolC|nr:TolC family protein [Halobacteriovoraceae bacterium]
MSKILLILLTSLVAQWVHAESITLVQLQEHAFKNNLILKAARANTEMANMEQQVTKASLYPKIGIELGLEQTTNIDTDVEDTERLKSIYSEYNLFNGFRDQNKLNQSRIYSKKAISELKESEFLLHLKIERLYFSYLYLNKNIEITKQAIIRNQVHLKYIKKRLASGLVTKTDLLEFKLRKSKLKSKLEYLNLNSFETQANIFRNVGLSKTNDLIISGELPHYEVNTSFEILLNTFNRNSESMKRAHLNIAEAKLETAIENSGWYPSVDLVAKHGNLSAAETGIDNDDTSTSITVVGRWELFSGFETQSASKKASINKLRQEHLLKQKVLDDSSFIQTNYQRLKAIESRIQHEEINSKIATELYAKTLKEYRKGVKDSGALSAAGDELTDISEKVYSLKMDFVKTKLTLESVIGSHVQLKQISHKH